MGRDAQAVLLRWAGHWDDDDRRAVLLARGLRTAVPRRRVRLLVRPGAPMAIIGVAHLHAHQPDRLDRLESPAARAAGYARAALAVPRRRLAPGEETCTAPASWLRCGGWSRRVSVHRARNPAGRRTLTSSDGAVRL
jgi:hypothetical protein